MPQRGNILFLILLAIILFAALNYAVMGQREQVGSGMSKEAANAAAANILGWLSTVNVAVQRLTVIKGIPYNQIDFKDSNNYNFNGTYRYIDNTDCTAPECEVFNPAGGGAISNNFSAYAPPGATAAQPNYVAAGSREYVANAIEGVGTALPDMVVEIAMIKREICNAVNQSLGLANCPSISKTGFTSWDSKTNIDASTMTLTGSAIKGQMTFCYCTTSANGLLTGQIVSVVMPR